MSNRRAAAIRAPLVGIVRQARGEQLFQSQASGASSFGIVASAEREQADS